MEPAQHPIGDVERNAPEGVKVVRRAGVEGGGEGIAVAEAPGSRRPAEGAFGGDVHGVRPEVRDAPADDRRSRHGEADLRIGGTGQGGESPRRDP